MRARECTTYIIFAEWAERAFLFVGTWRGLRGARRAFQLCNPRPLRTWTPGTRPGTWIVGGTQQGRREVVPELDKFLVYGRGGVEGIGP